MKRLSDRAEHRGTFKHTRMKTDSNEATAVTTIASVMLNPQISTRVIESTNMVYQDRQPIEF